LKYNQIGFNIVKVRALFFILIIFIVSCASQTVTQIEPAMEKNKVLDIMGEPKDRVFDGRVEKWLYEINGKKKLVVFENGKVTEFSNVEKFENVKFEEAKNLLCTGSNQYGKFPEGGGCNMYGCWPKGGYCNAFGCTKNGICTARGCPEPIESYLCKD